MTARTIVGPLALIALIGIGIYLLVQIPWEFGVGGIAALVGIWLAIGRSAPDAM